MELDESDISSHHALAYDAQGKAIGTGRLLPDGHIGRIAVLPEWRGRGVGTGLLRCLLEVAVISGKRRFALNAQSPAAGFYARFGFRSEGAEFVEAGISHQKMTLSLQA
ncbi:MAG: GNAT family N-acetyltransferase [Sterolibacterium sp.]|nr:GNAT family N-acetyltransferase [Sterolibacterium sp.]